VITLLVVLLTCSKQAAENLYVKCQSVLSSSAAGRRWFAKFYSLCFSSVSLFTVCSLYTYIKTTYYKQTLDEKMDSWYKLHDIFVSYMTMLNQMHASCRDE